MLRIIEKGNWLAVRVANLMHGHALCSMPQNSLTPRALGSPQPYSHRQGVQKALLTSRHTI
jgi:hypothetical protein